MNMLIIDKQNMFLIDSFGQILLKSRPNFSFKYMGISYSHVDKTKYVLSMGKWSPAALEPSEIDEIEAFISEQRSLHGVKIHAVDRDGTYLGQLKSDDGRIFMEVPPPPNDDHYYWDFEAQKWIYVHAVDAEGNYLGNIPHTLASRIVKEAPPHANYVWDSLEERYVKKEKSLEQERSEAMARLDELRFIRRAILDKHPLSNQIRQEIRTAVKQIFMKYDLSTLVNIEDTRLEILNVIRSTDSIDVLKDKSAVIQVMVSEMSQLAK